MANSQVPPNDHAMESARLHSVAGTSRSVNAAPTILTNRTDQAQALTARTSHTIQTDRSAMTDRSRYNGEESYRDVEVSEEMSEEALKRELELAKEEKLRQKEIDRKLAKEARTKAFSLNDWMRSWFVTDYSLPEEQLEEYRMLSGLEPEYICELFNYFHDETYTAPGQLLSKEMFLEIPFVESNPLKERLALCFGYDDEVHEMNFEQFLQGVALFNSHGKREEKLKLAFRMHDIDGDNQISKQDLTTYMQLVCGEESESYEHELEYKYKHEHDNKIGNSSNSNMQQDVSEDDGGDDKDDSKEEQDKDESKEFNSIDKVDLVDEVFRESSSDPKGQYLSFQDFSRVMAPTDFHTKLLLPF